MAVAGMVTIWQQRGNSSSGEALSRRCGMAAAIQLQQRQQQQQHTRLGVLVQAQHGMI
jgi:hypothetical protein